MNFGREEMRPELGCLATTDLGPEIECKESVKDVVGQKSKQQEALDGLGVMAIDGVRLPALDQFLEPVVFDVP
jgi:hypothetical protein